MIFKCIPPSGLFAFYPRSDVPNGRQNGLQPVAPKQSVRKKLQSDLDAQLSTKYGSDRKHATTSEKKSAALGLLVATLGLGAVTVARQTALGQDIEPARCSRFPFFDRRAAGEAKLLDQTILQRPIHALDAALGLATVGAKDLDP